ncbi:S13-like H2TH domain-containing protein [Cystobasidium minutum MCA 4210]|uniref:mitochondrial 37S ribosomal protein uS13m n=1 Tax=Cystobasidium minutum MCA 4210 TaxID=1397322 RepID=UPI0034D020D8|eukprot:jgi/Rhomi1/195055/gm1.3269_g
MHVLGVNLPDRKLLKIALTSFHGISHNTSRLICARLGFHDRLLVSELTEPQINELSALLSSPQSYMSSHASSSESSNAAAGTSREYNQLSNLIIESDLRREVRANIQHHRTVGSYKGRRHAMGFPVRGQRTKSNAKTAKKLNRVERRAFSTSTGSPFSSTTTSSLPTSQPPTPLLHSLRWRFRLANARL